MILHRTHPYDSLRPFGVERTSISGYALRLQESLTTLVDQHQYPQSVNVLLCQLASLTALLHGSFKMNGILTLQVKGDGLIDTLVCDVDHQGALRGYAHFNEDILTCPYDSSAPLSTWIGEGYLLLVLDPEEGARYQGVVALTGATLVDCVEHYFTQSVQHPTKIVLATQGSKDFAHEGFLGQADRLLSKASLPHKWKAGAVMIQQHSDGFSQAELMEHWAEALCHMSTISASELLEPDSDHLDGLLFRLFHEHGVRVHDARPIMAQCRCSQEKIQKAVDQAMSEQLQGDVVLESVPVTCEFCSFVYDILVPPAWGD